MPHISGISKSVIIKSTLPVITSYSIHYTKLYEPKFGARAAAGNTLEDIQKLCEYAHLFFAKVYVTLNTILFDNELAEAEQLIHQLYEIKVDAIIIQDMGILEMDLPRNNFV